MKRRLLLWMVTAMLTIVGVQQAKAYSTSELESDGWTKVTDMTSMTLSEYYFMLIDAGTSLYSVSNARPGTDSKPTYQTLQDPVSDAGQVWKISNDGSAYYLQSLVDGWYFIGARNANQGWTDYMAAESTNGNFAFAVTDGKFSITSVFANGLVGPWEDADHVDLNYKLHWNALEDNFYEELACNKGAQHAPGFYIYAISRATYDNIRRSSSKLAANGWTQVTGTDQLGKSGYYYTLLDVSETGYESGLVMAGGTGRPNYQAMNISSNNKIQLWTMASKGEGYQMKNCQTDTYVFCNNGTDWNTGFTNDADNQYTEFRFTLNNGFWVISNVNSLERSLGRWSNSPYRPGTGENIAANKADNEGKRQFLIYSISSIILDKPEGKMNATVQSELNAAYDAYLTDPSDENTATVNEKIAAAKASIAVYQQIATLFTEQQMGSIQGWTDAKVYTDYNDGVYETLQQAVEAYKTYVANYWSANTPGENADLTGFITNQGFEFGDMTSWTNTPSSDTGVRDYSNPTYAAANGEGAHLFNTWWKGSPITQSIANLPNGTYRLKVSVASDGATIYLTANGRHNEGTETGGSYPSNDTFQEATFDFVVTNGEATIGVVGGANGTAGEHKDYVADGYWWYKADNFRLIYVSAGATAAPELVNAPMNAGIRTAQQTAFDTWDANKTVENYQALLDAIAAAQESADKYVIIDQRIPKLAAQSDGKVTEAALKAKYTSEEYVEADDVFTEYRNVIAAYYATNAPAADDDLTEFIINPSFEFGNIDGWNETHGGRSPDVGARDAHNETYEFSDSEGDYVFNSWNDGFGAITLDQTLYGLPQGTYELTAVFASEGFNNIEFIGTNIREDGTPDETADKFRPVDINQRADKKTGLPRTITVFVTDSQLKIGGNTWGFFKADNFRLVYKSANIADPDLSQPMNTYEKDNYIAAKAAYQTNPTQENLREWAASKIIVENSIKAYKEAKKTLDHVKDMMDHTNVYTYDAFFTIDDMYRKYGPEEGFYGFRTLEDDVAYDLERMFFGTGGYRDHSNKGIPAIPFIASAWDCADNGFAYANEGFTEGSDYYGNSWSREGLDDGTNMLTPYLEYWLYGDQLLDPRTMTATVEGTPNAEYSVKMFVRVRTNVKYVEGDDSTKPYGMTIQIGDGEEFTPNWQYIDNEGTQYVLNNGRQLWVCNLWLPAHQGDANNPTYILPTGNADADGKFEIKFHIKDDSNVTWLSMKDVYVNYENEVPETEMAALKAQIDYADNNHKLGFDFKGDENGTTVDEYAPYNNVPQLIALKRAKQVYDSPQNVFLVRNVTKALKAVNYTSMADDLHPVYNEATDLWKKNTEEMNGFYWKNNYTSADVQHVEWYEFEDDCITPSGWELIGRNDGFSTGIKKLGVNTEDKGMKAFEDQTGLLTKYETDYGNQVGYTLPLKKGVKYIMTFKYAYMGEGECPETTDITLTVPAAGATGDDTQRSGLEITSFKPEGQGTEDLGKWYMYRATFTPTFENEEHPGEPVNYLITFDKDNAHDPVPVMMGELTLVRYQDEVDVINGESKDFTYEYEPEFIGTNATVTRSFNAGAYNTLVLPFTLAGHELKEALGSNFDGKVYYYTGVGTTSGESRDYYQLKFEERESGIFANVPVLFYSDASNPVDNWDNKNFTNMVTRYVKNDLTVDTDVFDFVGTYKTQKVPEGGWYIKADNNFYKSTTNKQKGLANIQPTRGYFIPYNTDGEVILHAKIMGFDIDDEPTGIMAIEEDGSMHVTSGNIYSVDGRLVRQNAKTLEGLPRGTYIVDGKKYMIK